jgi:hypothetical protein
LADICFSDFLSGAFFYPTIYFLNCNSLNVNSKTPLVNQPVKYDAIKVLRAVAQIIGIVTNQDDLILHFFALLYNCLL